MKSSVNTDSLINPLKYANLTFHVEADPMVV